MPPQPPPTTRRDGSRFQAQQDRRLDPTTPGTTAYNRAQRGVETVPERETRLNSVPIERTLDKAATTRQGAMDRFQTILTSVMQNPEATTIDTKRTAVANFKNSQGRDVRIDNVDGQALVRLAVAIEAADAKGRPAGRDVNARLNAMMDRIMASDNPAAALEAEKENAMLELRARVERKQFLTRQPDGTFLPNGDNARFNVSGMNLGRYSLDALSTQSAAAITRAKTALETAFAGSPGLLAAAKKEPGVMNDLMVEIAKNPRSSVIAAITGAAGVTDATELKAVITRMKATMTTPASRPAAVPAPRPSTLDDDAPDAPAPPGGGTIPPAIIPPAPEDPDLTALANPRDFPTLPVSTDRPPINGGSATVAANPNRIAERLAAIKDNLQV
ncbi:MAG: hypothetical protein K2Q01_09535 [Rickettsiales bacterium]|nr:hypothetical protein [Rickettsiales bacterium]